jgi:beta-glucosidase-like glycosyl hydrolase
MADVETGVGQQVRGCTSFPGVMALGATRSLDLAFRVGRATAREAVAIGINTVLAPVLDVNTNPLNPIIGVRSFGEEPDRVADLGAAYIRGIRETGALAVAKHFPGHGDTASDSHTELPVIRRGLGSLRSIELPPFERAISEGVDAVMVGHIALPGLTGGSGIPASLSERVVSDLLREELGFDGLILTDAMIMEGVRRGAEEPEAVLEALRAGVDMILYVEEFEASVAAVRKAVEDGSLDRSRIDSALDRIDRARRNVAKLPAVDEPDFTDREHRELARKVAELSVTLVRNRDRFFPLSGGGADAFIVYDDDDESTPVGSLDMALREHFPGTTVHRLTRGSGMTDEWRANLTGVDRVVIFVLSPVRAWRGVSDLSVEGRGIIDHLLRGIERAGVVSMGSPYMLRHFPWIDAYLCLYGDGEASCDAALRAIAGDIPLLGRLPVTIPGLYPCGWGLSLERTGERT